MYNNSHGIAEYLKGYKFALTLNDANSINKINQFLYLMDNEEAYYSMQSGIVKMINEYCWHKHVSRLLQGIGVAENRSD